MRGVVLLPLYVVGQWHEALTGADAFIAELEAGHPHYLASNAYFTRALIRVGRDRSSGAAADAELALDAASRTVDPRSVLQTVALAAHVFLELGDRERAASLAERYLDALRKGPIGFSVVSADVAASTLVALGRGEEIAEALEPYPHLWARAGHAVAIGDPVGGAEICAEIGAVSREAYLRLFAARSGDLAQLESPLAFYRSVGATRYVRECEALLPTQRLA
jgi:hypothetical protein